MNAKSKMKVLHAKRVIEMNTTFAKMIENPFSEEYAFLQKIRQDYPEYKVTIREINKNPNKETYAGLTYQYMRDYIILHSTPEEEADAVAEFDEMLLISRCHSKGHRYPVIKQWFLAKYPEIKDFGTNTAEKEKAAEQTNEETAPSEEATTSEEAIPENDAA